MQKYADDSIKIQVVDDKEKDSAFSGFCSRVLNFFQLNKLLKQDRTIKQVFEDDGKTPMSQVIKILVLGPGDSGKSTILKQMRLIHGNNYTDSEKKKYKPVVIKNIIDSIFNLINAMNLFTLSFENPVNQEYSEAILECKKKLNYEIDDWNENSQTYAAHIKSIWDDPSITFCIDHRNKFYLSDSIEYFVKNLDRICAKDYVPEIDDILRARQPTTAIQEYKYKISSTYFLFVDVGGQRSERRKWINCFENVTSLLFVASLSDYDLFLTKDELRAGNIDDPNASVNRMQDALGLFRNIINWKKKIYANESKKAEDSKKANKPTNASKQPNGVEKEVLLFDKISIILFLNKEDVFEKKFGRSSIKTCFPDYDERLSCEESKGFIARKFIESDKSSILPDGSKREIYWHYTFALDRNNIDTVVTSVKDRIIKYMLDSMRL